MQLVVLEALPNTTMSWLLYLLLAFLLLTIAVGAVTSSGAKDERRREEPGAVRKPSRAARRATAPKKPTKQV